MPAAHPLVRAARHLADAVDACDFADPVAYVYNPLRYAWSLHRQYLERFGSGRKRVVFLGMNPGPFGMAQTGVPFGEIPAVRDWMGLSGAVETPEPMHPKRPVQGLACTKSEVSGRRLWGAFAERYPVADDFFAEHFVLNYCPLVFMEAGGRNRTPDKLPASEREPLFAACDTHLRRCIDVLDPHWLIGVGAFARDCLRRIAGADGRQIGNILHPSPASPAANRGWQAAAFAQLREQGVWPDDVHKNL